MDDREERQAKSIDKSAVVLEKLVLEYPELTELGRYHRAIQAAAEAIQAAGVTVYASRGRSNVPAAGKLARKKLRAELLLPTAHRSRRYFYADATVLGGMRVPHAHASLVEHADAALGMAQVLAPYRTLWRDAGLPPTIARDLKTAAKSIRALATVRERSVQKGAVASREIARLIRGARADIRLVSILFAAEAMRREADGDFRNLFVQWQSAARVGHRIGRPLKRRRRKPPPGDAE